MWRPYTQVQYRELVQQIRETIPGVSLSTDMIVGFPGETEVQYQRSLQLISDLRFDKVHTAAYSPGRGASPLATWKTTFLSQRKQDA